MMEEKNRNISINPEQETRGFREEGEVYEGDSAAEGIEDRQARKELGTNGVAGRQEKENRRELGVFEEGNSIPERVEHQRIAGVVRFDGAQDVGEEDDQGQQRDGRREQDQEGGEERQKEEEQEHHEQEQGRHQEGEKENGTHYQQPKNSVVRYLKGYQYVCSSQLGALVHQEVNYMGIVVEWEKPRRTKGPDLMCNLKLTDFSSEEMGGPIELRVFAPNVNQLPRVKQPGDIIRLHRVRVSEFIFHQNGEAKPRYQLVASLSRIGKFHTNCSFCLFHGGKSAKSVEELNTPYQKSSKTYHFNSHEADLLQGMREDSAKGKWKRYCSFHNEGEDRAYRKQIKSVFLQSNVLNFWDLIGLVVRVQHQTVGNHTVVWMWDGTDAPPYPPMYDSRPRILDEQGATVTEIEINHILSSMERLELEIDAWESSPPPFGTFVPVIFSAQLEFPSPGTWVKLRNCGFHVIEGQLQGFLTQKSRWVNWKGDIDALIQAAVADKHGTRATLFDHGEIISETLNSSKPITSIREALWTAEKTLKLLKSQELELSTVQCMYFRCLARTTCVWRGADEIQYLCTPRKAFSNDIIEADIYDSTEWVFTALVTLEDPTGSLEAYLFGKEADYFFSEVSPALDLTLEENAENLAALRKAILRMHGIANNKAVHVKGTWLDVCIMLYWQNDESGGLVPKYRICDTKLLPVVLQSDS